MSDQTLRKELKHDAVAPTLAHVFSNVSAHRSQIYKYGGAVVAVALVVGLTFYYRDYTAGVRQAALGEAIQAQAAPIGAPQAGVVSFATESAKREAIVKAYTKLLTEQAGSSEGYIAEYALGAIDVENGKLTEARKKFDDVASGGGAEYGSMARLALAQIAFAEDKTDEARKLLKDLADNPTAMVSKNQANFILARGLSAKQPAEARKILIALVEPKSDISQIAVTALGELPPQ